MNARPRPGTDSPRPRPHKPFAPRPAGWPKRPIPKVPPLPKGSPFLIGKALGKAASKAIPILGAAITAYEVYDYLWNGSMQGAGWVPHPTVNCPRTNPRLGWGNPANTSCQTTGISTLPLTYAQVMFAATIKEVHLGTPTTSGSPRYRNGLQWVRTIPSPALIPQPGVLPVPAADPFAPPLPALQPKPRPQELPIKKPAPQPRTAPRPVGRPLPGEQPSRAPLPKGRPRPGRDTKPEYHPIPNMPFPITLYPTPGGGVPNPIQPDQVIDFKPPTGGKPGGPKPGRETPRVRQRPNSARNRPKKRKREKERKPDTRVKVRGALGLINLATEANDFLNVLYDALPEDSPCKRGAERDTRKSGKKYVTPYHKAKAVYDCFSSIDVGNAIEGYVNNQVEDYVFGMIGQQVGKATGNFGVTTGLNRALQKQQELAQGEGPGIGDLIPQIDIDDETGELTVTVPQFGSVGFGAFGSGKVTTKRPTKGK